MSLTLAVALKVYELGCGTADTIAPHFPGYSRKQVIKALSNAVHDRDWITCDGHAPKRGRGGRGSVAATYRAKAEKPAPKKRVYTKGEKPKKPARIRLLKRQIPSVFHLGASLL